MPNTIALAYTLIGYGLGVWLLTVPPWWLNLVGLLLTAHTLVYAAYYIHEFAHQSIFRTAEANNRWGTAMTWITGSCYAPFAALRRKHMRHHLDRADVLTLRLQGCDRAFAALGSTARPRARMGLRACGGTDHARLRDAAALPQGRARERAPPPGRDHRDPRRAVRPARRGFRSRRSSCTRSPTPSCSTCCASPMPSSTPTMRSRCSKAVTSRTTRCATVSTSRPTRTRISCRSGIRR